MTQNTSTTFLLDPKYEETQAQAKWNPNDKMTKIKEKHKMISTLYEIWNVIVNCISSQYFGFGLAKQIKCCWANVILFHDAYSSLWYINMMIKYDRKIIQNKCVVCKIELKCFLRAGLERT